MSNKIKVRFNLGRGKNYMKWKVQHNKDVIYYNPADVTLFMTGCVLKNNKSAAEKIHQGANKNVCAWVLCDELFITSGIEQPAGGTQLKYNPRVQPNWTADEANVDNHNFETVFSKGKQLFGIK